MRRAAAVALVAGLLACWHASAAAPSGSAAPQPAGPAAAAKGAAAAAKTGAPSGGKAEEALSDFQKVGLVDPQR